MTAALIKRLLRWDKISLVPRKVLLVHSERFAINLDETVYEIGEHNILSKSCTSVKRRGDKGIRN